MTFQKILLATDFFPPAREALHTAVELSRSYGAALTIVYVYEPVAHTLPEGHMLYTPLQTRELMAAFERRLADVKVEAEAAGAPSVETKMLIGGAAGQITDFAATQNFDLITIGTHGRKGISHLLLGSVAERVVRTAACPVLTVRLRETRTGKSKASR